jgi:hypothetical protein
VFGAIDGSAAGYTFIGCAYTLAIVVMAGLATYILRKSRAVVLGQECTFELQLMVATVATVYCVANLPCAAVYFMRAHLYPQSMMFVPKWLRATQATFHVLNSSCNFIIYICISSKFRLALLQLFGRRVGREEGEKEGKVEGEREVEVEVEAEDFGLGVEKRRDSGVPPVELKTVTVTPSVL